MVSVLLTILKTIGITLLIILSIILLVLLLILFCAVRYRAAGEYLNKDDYVVEGRVTWLLHIISAKVFLGANQPLHLCIKVFGITAYDNLRPNNRKRRNKKSKSTQAKTDSTSELKAASTESQSSIETSRELKKEEGIEEPVFSDERISIDIQQFQTDEDKKTQKAGFFRRIKTIIENFVNVFKNIKFTIHKICARIKRIKDNIRYYLKVLQLDSTKQAFVTCQKQLSRIFKSLCPKKFQVNLHLGFDDPSIMGDVLAVWGMAYPWHQGNIDIRPEFDKSVAEGDFLIKGRLRIFVLVWAAIVILCDRNIKLFIKHLKRDK